MTTTKREALPNPGLFILERHAMWTIITREEKQDLGQVHPLVLVRPNGSLAVLLQLPSYRVCLLDLGLVVFGLSSAFKRGALGRRGAATD